MLYYGSSPKSIVTKYYAKSKVMARHVLTLKYTCAAENLNATITDTLLCTLPNKRGDTAKCGDLTK